MFSNGRPFALPRCGAAASGNARAGNKGRGTGVCMGLVMYKSSPGGIGFLHDILERMPVVNDVDQGIANHFLGGSRGSQRDTDKYNAEIWTGQYKETKYDSCERIVPPFPLCFVSLLSVFVFWSCHLTYPRKVLFLRETCVHSSDHSLLSKIPRRHKGSLRPHITLPRQNRPCLCLWVCVTRWAQVPQTRYARHGGGGLVTVADHIDLHVSAQWPAHYLCNRLARNARPTVRRVCMCVWAQGQWVAIVCCACIFSCLLTQML